MTNAPENNFAKILSDSGLFNDIDIYFAELVCRLARDENSYALFLASLLASYVVNDRRQICLPLTGLPENFSAWLLSGNEVELDAESVARLATLQWPANWEAVLAAHAAVAGPKDAHSKQHLLVLDNGRLYLQRYWDYEQRLAGMISARLKAESAASMPLVRALSEIAPRFAAVFADNSLNYQAAAVCAGLRNQFTIISGGPGCGKTSVVTAIAALWLESEPSVRITLCAPTGRAQARLRQALLEESEFLDFPDAVKEKLINLQSATIHRLLGYRPGRGFRYHSENRLPVDLLIVDEASMVPLTLMANLFTALPEACKVILLGDRNQLASVEAGAVLGDLSSTGAENFFSDSFMADFARLTGTSVAGLPSPVVPASDSGAEKLLFQDHIIELEKSYRFAPDGGIARLQREILTPAENDENRLTEILTNDSSGEVGLRYLSGAGLSCESSLYSFLSEMKIDFAGREVPFRSYIDAPDMKTAFAMFSGFRLLSPLRRGPLGVESLNRIMMQVVGGSGFSRYSQGASVMITRNAPQLDLYNGDIGLVWPDKSGRLMVWFERADGEFTPFTLLQLPGHESAFATTVHKAQGSGFQKVVLIWPGGNPALLTREMLYTGITRAARRVEIWLPEKVLLNSLVAACGRQVGRDSGLLQALL